MAGKEIEGFVNLGLKIARKAFGKKLLGKPFLVFG